MTALDKLLKAQAKNRSMVCVGLDLDTKKMPAEYVKSSKGMFDFACRLIEATADKVCAYKPNIAFYEALGPEGLSLLRQIIGRIPNDVPIILDAKRGDIGNTASHYAQSLYEHFGADWVTLNPYMGYDSLRPFLEHKDKGAFILCLTSNTGARDFQMLQIDGKPLYAVVAEKVDYWNKFKNCGLVVGATAPEQLTEIRAISGEMPILIPGVGAQGGSLDLAAVNGTDHFRKPALINVSRSVLYASDGADFADKARAEVLRLNQIIDNLRSGELDEKDSKNPGSDADSGQQQNQPPQPQSQPQQHSQQQQQNQPQQQQQHPNQQPPQEQPRPDQSNSNDRSE